ncbi:MAG: hypothetical protein Q4P72_00685 [Eubacteriales bacterium]|nr:hypothetical protein [Eubacteriales bacterium]
MMHVEALVEDRSGALIFRSLCEQELSGLEAEIGLDITNDLRAHRGLGHLPRNWDAEPSPLLGGLLDLLPAKLRAYRRILDVESDLLIICFDSDRNDPEELREQIETVLGKYYQGRRAIIAIAVEELESWMLADEAAIASAYPDYDAQLYQQYQQDSVCGTWEYLCRVLEGKRAEQIIEEGYPSVGRYKMSWAERISPLLDAEHNQSPSYISFRRKLRKALRQKVHPQNR